VVDDYGHHPTEILATLQAARECRFARVHVIFQPHRYTRTRDLMTEFGGAFGQADSVEVLDIYAASEEPIAGVTGEALAGEIAGGKAHYAASVGEAIAAVVARARPGDVVITQGAGSVSSIAPMLLGALESRE
jgi:UDP-N-acetylmuramate--alanine ligase